ncbi:dipeptidase [Vibrio comitans]
MKHTLIASLLLSSTSVLAHDIGHEHEHIEGGWNAKAGFVSDIDVQSKLWNPRGKTQEEILERAEYLNLMYNSPRTPEQEAKDNAFRNRFSDAIYVNTILPAALGVKGFSKHHIVEGLQRNVNAGVTFTSLSTYNYPSSQITTETDTFNNTSAVASELGLKKVHTVKEVRHNHAKGITSYSLNTQGADFAIADMSLVGKYSKMGVKQMNFVYNSDNALAGGGSNNDKGVTELGKEFIKEANKNGVIVDVSHSSSQTAIDAANYSTKPVIASHSNAYGLHPIGRNLTDEAILAVGKSGGAVCTTGVGMFLNAEGDASPEAFAKHVVYTADLIGKDKTCFSTDFLHNYQDFLAALLSDTDQYPPELGMGGPTANITVEQGWAVACVLSEDYGWTDQDVRGFLGENVLRVYEANWDK